MRRFLWRGGGYGATHLPVIKTAIFFHSKRKIGVVEDRGQEILWTVPTNYWSGSRRSSQAQVRKIPLPADLCCGFWERFYGIEKISHLLTTLIRGGGGSMRCTAWDGEKQVSRLAVACAPARSK